MVNNRSLNYCLLNTHYHLPDTGYLFGFLFEDGLPALGSVWGLLSGGCWWLPEVVSTLGGLWCGPPVEQYPMISHQSHHCCGQCTWLRGSGNCTKFSRAGCTYQTTRAYNKAILQYAIASPLLNSWLVWFLVLEVCYFISLKSIHHTVIVVLTWWLSLISLWIPFLAFWVSLQNPATHLIPPSWMFLHGFLSHKP